MALLFDTALPLTTPRPLGAGPAAAHDAAVLLEQRKQGRVIAESLGDAAPHRRSAGAIKARVRQLRSIITAGVPAHPSTRTHRDWIAENWRLLAATLKDVRMFAGHIGRLPALSASPARTLRVVHIAEAFLERTGAAFDEERFNAFLEGVQQRHVLTMGEIWAARPALQLALMERLVEAVRSGSGAIPALVCSLRAVAESRWKDVFARVNLVDPRLAADPAGSYTAMDDDSREHYRRIVTELAEHSGRAEHEVAAEAVALAREAAALGGSGRAAERRQHVGYYLIDDGLPLLRRRIGYQAPFRQRWIEYATRRPTAAYLGAGSLATLATLWLVLHVLDYPPYGIAAALLLLLPAMQAGIDLANALATGLVGPRRLPKLDFATGVPEDCATLVAVPALLLNERHVRNLVMDMEIRYLANRDRHIMFALVTNSRDTVERGEERHEVLQLCERLVRELNHRYGSGTHTPFYLLHRFRAYNPSEDRWIGWERKRGKLLDLNQLLRGVRDRFPVKVGNLDTLKAVRYVIVLDSDTELPRDAARRLIGAMAHPLNRAVIDPRTDTVVEGYGILQPQISVSTRSASRSWLASLYSGEIGFDIYTRAVSDVYQDLFREGIFTGKGIYEVDTFRTTLERRFPTNTLLSHDLIEGLFARAALVSDVELVDDYPTHFSAYCRRRHRWMRGDWQIMRWLFGRVPNARRQLVDNPLTAISRWKILDNLRRTLVEPALLVALLAAWFVLPRPGVWTAAAVALLLAPTYWRLLLAMMRAPWWSAAFRPWALATLTAFGRSHLVVALHLAYLLHDALLSLDAIARALARMFVTGRRLLEWETAAEASQRTRGATDIYLEWSPFIAAGIGAALWLAHPGAVPAAAPLLLAWVSARAIARWLNRPPAAAGNLADADVWFLREQALRTWRFFTTFSTHRNHWLIPDSVRADGTIAARISPTNLAMLLNARVAAVQFGYLTVPEFVTLTQRTLTTIRRLPRYRGHFLNWYDTDTLAVLEPRFVSTVDSGNLAAALWALKQAALGMARQAPSDTTLWQGVEDVARMLAAATDPAARAVADRVLKTHAQWRQSLPELESLVLRFVAAAGDQEQFWAHELHARLRAARLWCEGGTRPGLAEALAEIARTADAFVAEMDFAFLYDRRRKVLSVGFDAAAGRLERSTYDLLASEARIASFVAIAKGDIPQESWLHLGRSHIVARDERVLLSWTGTLFEYLMPALWCRSRPRTIVHDSMRAAIAVQRKFARAQGIPWGFSESGFIADGSPDYGYAPCGVPDLALKPLDSKVVVVSPYSACLALLVEPDAAIRNLHHLQRLGAVGRFGFYEALDCSERRTRMVESWMSHHMGMSLLAFAGVLLGHPLQRAFHAEPHVRATERLLDERVPRAIVPDRPEAPRVLWPEESAA